MTTFQAIVYGVIHGFTEFLPISWNAHRILVPYLLGWEQPAGPFIGALTLGTLLAVLIYFIHDWLSMVSCFLQVLIYRKRPMTLDERLPFFLTLSTIPVAAAWVYLHDPIGDLGWPPLWTAIALAGFSLPLWFSESISRKNKGPFDWNWFDCLFLGIFQIAMLVPGCGRPTAALTGAMFRNYKREAAVKYVFFASAPILAATTYLHLKDIQLHGGHPIPDVSWLTLVVAIIVSLLSGLLAIGGFMKQIERKGFGQYVAYRWVLAAGVVAVWWIRGRH